MNTDHQIYRKPECCFNILRKGILYCRGRNHLVSFLALFISVGFYTTLQSQTPVIDSLKKSLSDSQRDKLSILFELCWHGESMAADSELRFAQTAKQISIEKKDDAGKLEADFFIARSYNMKGRADTSLVLCDKGLQQITDTNKMFALFRDFMWYKIVSLTKLRKIKESIDECFRLLESGERHNDILAQGIACNCLGVNYNILLNRKEALNWLNKAFQIVKNDSTNRIYLQVFVNLSAVYFYHNNMDSGYYFLNHAMAGAKIKENLKVESDCLTLQGLVYSIQNKMDSAENVLQKAVAIQKQIGNVQYILVGLDALETFYAKQKDYPKAIGYIKQAEEYARRFNEPLVFQFYQDLAECYKQMKNYQAYGETLDTLMMIKDSLYQKSKAEDLAKLEAQYDVSSKEAFIAKQKLELLNKDLWIAAVALVTFFFVAAAYLVYRRNRRRQRIALKEAEENERKRIAADLHDNIGAYASAISAGIDEIESRKLITDASTIRHLKNNATEIMASLRDTIWAFNKESITLTGISDRIKIYTQKMQPAYPQVSISIEEDIRKEKKLSPVQALHIFRIVQEALHNALQHSHCNKVSININSNDEVAEIKVEDNGNGFDPQSVHHAGNGLQNMKSRATEAGFDLAFGKIAPKGTQVSLAAKMNA